MLIFVFWIMHIIRYNDKINKKNEKINKNFVIRSALVNGMNCKRDGFFIIVCMKCFSLQSHSKLLYDHNNV